MVEKKHISVKVNGESREAEVEPRMLLVHFLREVAGLTGTHVGCDTTNCGACTVLLDGKAVKSCTILAVQADRKRVTTIEGLSGHSGKMHPIQKAFVDNNGLQCGFCTSGMIISAYWLLKKKKNVSEDEIRASISGNLCRCTGYDNIVTSIKDAERMINEQGVSLEEEETVTVRK